MSASPKNISKKIIRYRPVQSAMLKLMETEMEVFSKERGGCVRRNFGVANSANAESASIKCLKEHIKPSWRN